MYIDYFYKLRLLLQILDLEEVLILKFIAGLLIHYRREVDLFENTSLNKAFQRALAIERKIDSRTRTPQSRPNFSPSNYQPTTNNPST